ncbi:MAG: glutamate-1-semialdehyde 2,1-aminomutase [Candidatus Omnitrophica bacterium]|nr:glutamate-1-semialdehyde 2,1-aminomutase [Candidatus Omnitrophota bacterium]
MAKKKKNSIIFNQAKRYLVGGVSSPVRAFKYVGGEPLLIKYGRGSKAYDYDGKRYIDYVLSWGSLILGHAHPDVIKVVVETIKNGTSFGTTNKFEAELAERIARAIPFVQKIRFVNSGTEAVMGVVRVARAYTKRDKILKFENSYHGHADYLLSKSGSGLLTFDIPKSAGVPKSFTEDTISIPYGDLLRLKKVFRRYGSKIAAVLVEPVGGNYGVVLPDIDFLKSVRGITKKYGSLLIADEIITGFRLNYGSAIQSLGIKPDLICLGKIIGGGLPVGAYGGRRNIMNNLAPEGKVYQASTFAGNPVVMQAGIATIKVLSKMKSNYEALSALTENLAGTLEKKARRSGVHLEVSRFGPMFSLRFEKKELFGRFYRKMLDEGVYLAPSEFEANFLSFAHTERDIKKTIDSAKAALEF